VSAQRDEKVSRVPSRSWLAEFGPIAWWRWAKQLLFSFGIIDATLKRTPGVVSNKIATSEPGFICDQRDKSKIVGVILIPFDGTFENKQDGVLVLIPKSSDQYDPSDLLQNWRNGIEYIFLESQDEVNQLASFLKANETNGRKSAHFFIPNDPDSGPQISNHIAINISGFSDGFRAFQIACDKSQ
jgi:hypothetical protein